MRKKESCQSGNIDIINPRAIRGMQGLNLKENDRILQILTVPCIYTFICLVYVKENLDDLSLRKPIHTNSTRNSKKYISRTI